MDAGVILQRAGRILKAELEGRVVVDFARFTL